MPITKTKGLVLKYVNLNDNDRLFTIFSSELGKITVISKGIRSHKHKDFAALQPFCFSEIVIEGKTGLGYISSAQIINNFFDIRTSVEKMSFASYFADLISIAADEINYDDDFFKFILNTYYMTSKVDADIKHNPVNELLKLKTIFELKLVCQAGYMPDAGKCGMCLSSKELNYFDLYNGHAVCESCSSRCTGELIKIESQVLLMIDYICLADYKNVFFFTASEKNIREANKISELYLINKMEIVSEKLEYLKSIIDFK